MIFKPEQEISSQCLESWEKVTKKLEDFADSSSSPSLKVLTGPCGMHIEGLGTTPPSHKCVGSWSYF